MSGPIDKVRQAAQSLTDEVKERAGGDTAQADQNKAVAHRLAAAFNRHDLTALDELATDDVVYHELPPGLPPGRAGYTAFSQLFLDAFPDLELTIHDLVAEGDKVAARLSFSGTHQGEFLGVAPTGRGVEVTGLTIIRLAGGRVAEQWEQFDMLGLMQQLGVIPASGQATA